MTAGTATHLHVCDHCGDRAKCDGTLEANYDGEPTVICSAIHNADGSTNPFLCETCAELPRCIYCGGIIDAQEATPYCSPSCARQAESEND